MIRELNKRSLAYGVPGLLIQTVGSFAHLPLLIITGSVLLIVGLAYYSKAKGHSGFWGLFGLLNLIGLIVLVILRDRILNLEDIAEAGVVRKQAVRRAIFLWPILIFGLTIVVPVVIFLIIAFLGVGK